jgi:6-pyruvoyltetrahydropterin/6-carboxytetrahydropterin synthase
VEGEEVITATRRFQYAIGHRVFGHEGKCKHLHGHNFVFFLRAISHRGELDSVGRVIDFGILKARFDPWFNEHWDHGMLVWEKDSEAIHALSQLPGQKLWVAPFNPTAENIARFILTTLGPNFLGSSDVSLTEVEVHETENGIAIANYEGSKATP